jgi:hypothetical protein
VEKLFKLREFLNVEDTARRLTFSFQEDVTQNDILNLVIDHKLPIAVVHDLLHVEDIASISKLCGYWFGEDRIKHAESMTLKEFLEPENKSWLESVLDDWLTHYELRDDQSEMLETNRHVQSARIIKEFKEIASHDFAVTAGLNPDPNHYSEPHRELLELLLKSDVFKTRQDEHWSRFYAHETSRKKNRNYLSESKYYIQGFIPTSKVYLTKSGVSRLSYNSQFLTSWIQALLLKKENEFAEYLEEMSGLPAGTILENPDGSLKRVRESPWGQSLNRDGKPNYPIILPTLDSIVFLRTDIEAFEASLNTSKNHSGVINNSENINIREKGSLLKILLGMAMSKYDYIPDARRNSATGENAGSIVADLQKHGIEVDVDTIRKFLKEASNIETK